MQVIDKLLINFKTKLSEEIASAVIREKEISWKQRELELANEKAYAINNIEKVCEHKLIHLRRENKDADERRQTAHAKEIARLSNKVKEIDAQLDLEKDNLKKVAMAMVKQEKFYTKKISEIEHINNRLKKWIETYSAELVRIQSDAEALIESAHKTHDENLQYIKKMIGEKEKKK